MYWEGVDFAGINNLEAFMIKGNTLSADFINIPDSNAGGIYIDSHHVTWKELLEAVTNNIVLNAKIEILENELKEIKKEMELLKKWSQV
jgi:hypothetical protein